MYQNVTEGKFMFFDNKVSKSSEFYHLEPGLCPSLTDTAEAMNTLIQERHNHKKNVEIHLANEGSGLAFFGRDLGHILGSNVGN